MQPVLYAGLRNPGRDQAIFNALHELSVTEVAEQTNCSRSTVKAAAKRIKELHTYQLTLVGGARTW